MNTMLGRRCGSNDWSSHPRLSFRTTGNELAFIDCFVDQFRLDVECLFELAEQLQDWREPRDLR